MIVSRFALVDPSLFTVPNDAKLADALRGLGHEVSIYGEARASGDGATELAGLRPLFYPELLQLGARGWPRQVLRVMKGAFHWRAMSRLVDDFAKSRPDVIHFQWLPLPLLDRRFLPALRRLAPVVLTVHDSLPFNGAAWRLQKIGATSIMGETDGVIVHTEQARDRLVPMACRPRGRPAHSARAPQRCHPRYRSHAASFGPGPVSTFRQAQAVQGRRRAD